MWNLSIRTFRACGAALALLVACSCLAGCSPDRVQDPLVVVDPAVSPGGTPPQADIYVDVMSGSDVHGDGSEDQPYRTITKALSLVQTGETVKVLPGWYGPFEEFPIQVPAGVKLMGDVENKGNGPMPTTIAGHGTVPFDPLKATATVVPGQASTVAGFVIRNGHESADLFVYDVAIAIDAALVEIRSNTIRDNVDNGIRFYAGAFDGLIRENNVAYNGIGLNFRFGGKETRVEKNLIWYNAAGIAFLHKNAGDLGGGTAGSEGGNIIGQNKEHDVLSMVPTGVFHAMHNYWDHAPPTEHKGLDGNKPKGVDIWMTNPVTIVTIGAKSFQPTIDPSQAHASLGP